MNRNIKLMFLMAGTAAILSSCHQPNASSSNGADSTLVVAGAALPKAAAFKKTVDGKEVQLYFLKNKTGSEAAITNFGGRLVSLLVKNDKGELVDVVLGHDQLEGYQKKQEFFFGALVGRYANRIAAGKFSLDGKTYQLQLNDGKNTLHGGFDGYYKQVWDAKQTDDHTLELSYLSKDGEAGYPGNLQVKVVYELTENNELKISYQATTDKATVLNLTNHAYFNLNGAGDSTITDHLLTINADEITPVDETLIPTGKLEKVNGTPFDFTKPTLIGARINDNNEQLKRGKGYDHNFVLRPSKDIRLAATLHSTKTGIYMDVLTGEPGLQFYSGNFLTGKETDGKGNKSYGYRSALCLETQHFPDSPNQPSFPSTVLKPGQEYKTTTIYKFYTDKK
nr:aldose epimerase family protein [Pedobacter sp. ASV19]